MTTGAATSLVRTITSQNDEVVHIDLETTGLNPLTDRIVTFGIATGEGCYAIDGSALDPSAAAALRKWLLGRALISYNAVFDMAFLTTWLGQAPTVGGCSLTLFRMLSTEGYKGQRWSLEVAMTDILGWETTQKSWLTDALTKHKLKKCDMFRLAALEPEPFARYCALDAEASRQLHAYLMWFVEEHVDSWGPAVLDQYEGWKTEIELLVEQELGGLHIDRPKLEAFNSQLFYDILKADGAVRCLPEVKKASKLWTAEATSRLIASMKARPTKRWATCLDDLQEPGVQWTFQASRSQKLQPWELEQGGRYYTQQVSTPKEQKLLLNFSSDDHVRWLLYGQLYPNVRTGEPDRRGRCPFILTIGDKEYELDATDSGRLPVDKAVMPVFGEVGKKLSEYNRLTKLKGYVERALERSAGDGLIHPKFRTHGTVTGRLAADGGFNLAQQSKVAAYLECYCAAPGWNLVQMDIAALEKVIQAEFSQDSNLL